MSPRTSVLVKWVIITVGESRPMWDTRQQTRIQQQQQQQQQKLSSSPVMKDNESWAATGAKRRAEGLYLKRVRWVAPDKKLANYSKAEGHR